MEQATINELNDTSNNATAAVAGTSTRGIPQDQKMETTKDGTSSMSSDKHKVDVAVAPAMTETPTKRGGRFWVIILSIAISMFLAALELSAVSTALPVIINELSGDQFIWIGSAYALASTAFLPMSGGLAQIFGRRPVMLGSLLIFTVGSAVCGAAPSLNVLIAGRTIQGLGGGGISSSTAIILSDMVTLQERGKFNGLIGVAWALASAMGPIIGGVLANHDNSMWRWLFYLNIPIAGVAMVLVLVFLDLPTPPGTLREKLSRMDWIGNMIVIGSTTALIIALTWGGVQFPWSSARVLVPLIVGIVGLGIFLAYEARYPKYPIVPYSLMSTRTGISGYIQTFIHSVCLLGLVYYMPVYFQACKLASPVGSGVDTFGLAFTLAPTGIIAGLSVAITQRFRPQLWAAWVFAILGMGLLSTLHADTNRGRAIGYQIVTSAGLGAMSSTTFFPVLAPLPVSANAHALAFFTFVRFIGQVWGVTIGGTILQNELSKRLPAEFFAAIPQGTSFAYSIIPTIRNLQPDSTRDAVRVAFAESLRVVWQTLIGVAGIGVLASLLMKHMKLHTSTDREWDLQEKQKPAATEDAGTREAGVAR